MPTFDIEGKHKLGPGFGCSCRAFRYGEPTPEQALAALARSANVTVEPDYDRPWRDADELFFTAWTEPDTRYKLTYDHKMAVNAGWCKHVISCITHWVPWFRQLALGAAWALDHIAELEKDNKRLEREVKKRERKRD